MFARETIDSSNNNIPTVVSIAMIASEALWIFSSKEKWLLICCAALPHFSIAAKILLQHFNYVYGNSY